MILPIDFSITFYHLELAPSQQVAEIFYILLTISLTKKPPERVAWIDGYGFVLGLSVRPRM